MTNAIETAATMYTINSIVVVMGGVNYEGPQVETMRVFVNRDNAVAYGESLVSPDSYDYYEIVEKEME